MQQNSPHTLFTQQVEVSNHYRLFLDDLIQEGAQLHEVLNTLHSATEIDTLEVRITSGGGYIRNGQQVINVMRDRFHDRSITVIDSEAASMSAITFMAGYRRIIYPHSVLMFHDLSMYNAGKASETLKQMETYIPIFKDYFQDIIGDTMTKKEVKSMFAGVDFWFDAEEMCKRGMAHTVIVRGKDMSAEDYLASLKEKKKKK